MPRQGKQKLNEKPIRQQVEKGDYLAAVGDFFVFV